MQSEASTPTVRVPPIPGVVEELHAAYGCRAGRRADGIVHVVMHDFNLDTTRAWADWTTAYLAALKAAGRREQHLYDTRQVSAFSIPPRSLQIGMRVNSAPGASQVHVALMTSNGAVAALANTAAVATVGAQTRLFTREEEALEWLHAMAKR